MNSTITSSRKNGIFFGWFTLVGVAMVVFTVGGAFINSFGVLLPVVTGEYGWSRAEVALGLTLGILAFGLPSPLYGVIVNRIGARRVIIIGNTIAALSLAGLYLVQEVWHIYLCYFMAGLGGGLGGYIACTAVLNNWFVRRRSLAVGIMLSFTGLAGFAYPPLATALIEAVGWRVTWLVFAGLIILLPVIIGGCFFIRTKPEDMGLTPDGIPPDNFLEYEKGKSSPEDKGEQAGGGIRQVLKRRTVWFIGGFAGANALTFGALVAHQIAYIQDIGFSPMTAATTISVLSAFSVMGSLGYGILAMKYNPRYLAVISFIIQLASLVMLLTTRELALVYIYSALLGYCNGSLITAFTTLVGAYYPRHLYSQVLGVVFPFHIVSHAVSATITGIVYDATSSYTPAFIALIFFCITGLSLAFMARRP